MGVWTPVTSCIGETGRDEAVVVCLPLGKRVPLPPHPAEVTGDKKQE